MRSERGTTTPAAAFVPAASGRTAGRGTRSRGETAVAQIQPLETRQHLSLNDLYGTTTADGNDIALDSTGTLHRVWRDTDSGTLKYAARDRAQRWSAISSVDSKRVGGEMSIQIDPAGKPSVAYYDRVNGDLWFAQLTGGNWIRTRVDHLNNVGDFPSLIFARDGRPHISYYDRTAGDLKLAWRSANGSWNTRTIETASNVGAYSSIAEASDGTMRIAYSDVDGLRLKYAEQKPNGVWFIRSIDKNATAGVRFTSLALDPRHDTPYIAYYDVRKKDLRVATVINGGTAWGSERVATVGAQGEFANLYFNANGDPAVVYLNRTLGTINEVVRDNQGGWSTRVVGVSGEHLAIAPLNDGRLFLSQYDTFTGALRTSPMKFDHTPGTAAGDRIIQWETIGGSGASAADHYVGWGIKQHGWQHYVNTRVAELRNLGMTRMFLHNPFGLKPNEHYMQFDQFIHAQEAGLTWLTTGFVEAWRPVTASGVEVIAYIGSLPHDDDFNNLADLDAYMARVMRSIDPLLKAGMSIGLDSIVGSNNDSRAFMVAQALRNSGVKVYAENRPPKDFWWWHDFGGVYYNTGYLTGGPDAHPSLNWAAPNSMLRGDVIRFLDRAPAGYSNSNYNWVKPTVINILRDGDTAALNFASLASLGLNVESLYLQAMGVASSSARPPSTGGGVTINPGTFGDDKILDDAKKEVL